LAGASPVDPARYRRFPRGETFQLLNTLWPQIPPQRFRETLTAFGQYTGVLHDLILYVIDNEIHHRGQGYVYLRALGIEPPPFFDRR
jgi:uncharacterized damage-inducible protein DinB